MADPIVYDYLVCKSFTSETEYPIKPGTDPAVRYKWGETAFDTIGGAVYAASLNSGTIFVYSDNDFVGYNETNLATSANITFSNQVYDGNLPGAGEAATNDSLVTIKNFTTSGTIETDGAVTFDVKNVTNRGTFKLDNDTFRATGTVTNIDTGEFYIKDSEVVAKFSGGVVNLAGDLTPDTVITGTADISLAATTTLNNGARVEGNILNLNNKLLNLNAATLTANTANISQDLMVGAGASVINLGVVTFTNGAGIYLTENASLSGSNIAGRVTVGSAATNNGATITGKNTISEINAPNRTTSANILKFTGADLASDKVYIRGNAIVNAIGTNTLEIDELVCQDGRTLNVFGTLKNSSISGGSITIAANESVVFMGANTLSTIDNNGTITIKGIAAEGDDPAVVGSLTATSVAGNIVIDAGVLAGQTGETYRIVSGLADGAEVTEAVANYEKVIYKNSAYLSRTFSDNSILYVNSAYSGLADGAIAADGNIKGYNAFSSFTDALREATNVGTVINVSATAYTQTDVVETIATLADGASINGADVTLKAKNINTDLILSATDGKSFTINTNITYADGGNIVLNWYGSETKTSSVTVTGDLTATVAEGSNVGGQIQIYGNATVNNLHADKLLWLSNGRYSAGGENDVIALNGNAEASTFMVTSGKVTTASGKTISANSLVIGPIDDASGVAANIISNGSVWSFDSNMLATGSKADKLTLTGGSITFAGTSASSIKLKNYPDSGKTTTVDDDTVKIDNANFTLRLESGATMTAKKIANKGSIVLNQGKLIADEVTGTGSISVYSSADPYNTLEIGNLGAESKIYVSNAALSNSSIAGTGSVIVSGANRYLATKGTTTITATINVNGTGKSLSVEGTLTAGTILNADATTAIQANATLVGATVNNNAASTFSVGKNSTLKGVTVQGGVITAADDFTLANYVDVDNNINKNIQLLDGAAINADGHVITQAASNDISFTVSSVALNTDDTFVITAKDIDQQGENDTAATITVHADSEFSGVKKLVDLDTADRALNFNLDAGLTLGYDKVHYDYYVAANSSVNMSTIKVNNEWSGDAFGTKVAEGYYVGFNAFGNIIDAFDAAKDLNPPDTVDPDDPTKTIIGKTTIQIDGNAVTGSVEGVEAYSFAGNVVIDGGKKVTLTIMENCEIDLNPAAGKTLTIAADTTLTSDTEDTYGGTEIDFNTTHEDGSKVVIAGDVISKAKLKFFGDTEVTGTITAGEALQLSMGRQTNGALTIDGSALGSVAQIDAETILFTNGDIIATDSTVICNSFYVNNYWDPAESTRSIVSTDTTWTITSDFYADLADSATFNGSVINIISDGSNSASYPEEVTDDWTPYSSNNIKYNGTVPNAQYLAVGTFKIDNENFILNLNASSLDIAAVTTGAFQHRAELTNAGTINVGVSYVGETGTVYDDSSIDVEGTVTNSGTITLTGAKDGDNTYTASLTAGAIVNQAAGEINASNGAVISSTASSTFDNNGTINIGTGNAGDTASTFTFVGRGRNYATMSVIGGTLNAGWLENCSDGSKLILQGATYNGQIASNYGLIKAINTTFNGPIANSKATNGWKGTYVVLTTNGEADATAITGNITNAEGASFRINQAADKTAEQTLSTDATKTAITGSITNAGEFKADYATITGSINNSGTFELANSSVSGGSVSITGTGTFTLSGTNKLEIGTATTAGTPAVTTYDGGLAGSITLAHGASIASGSFIYAGEGFTTGKIVVGTHDVEVTPATEPATYVKAADEVSFLGTVTMAATALDNIGGAVTLGSAQAAAMVTLGNIANSGTITVNGTLTASSIANKIDATAGTITINGNIANATPAITINGTAASDKLSGGTVQLASDITIGDAATITVISGKVDSANTTFKYGDTVLTNNKDIEISGITYRVGLTDANGLSFYKIGSQTQDTLHVKSGYAPGACDDYVYGYNAFGSVVEALIAAQPLTPNTKTTISVTSSTETSQNMLFYNDDDKKSQFQGNVEIVKAGTDPVTVNLLFNSGDNGLMLTPAAGKNITIGDGVTLKTADNGGNASNGAIYLNFYKTTGTVTVNGKLDSGTELKIYGSSDTKLADNAAQISVGATGTLKAGSLLWITAGKNIVSVDGTGRASALGTQITAANLMISSGTLKTTSTKVEATKGLVLGYNNGGATDDVLLDSTGTEWTLNSIGTTIQDDNGAALAADKFAKGTYKFSGGSVTVKGDNDKLPINVGTINSGEVRIGKGIVLDLSNGVDFKVQKGTVESSTGKFINAGNVKVGKDGDTKASSLTAVNIENSGSIYAYAGSRIETSAVGSRNSGTIVLNGANLSGAQITSYYWDDVAGKFVKGTIEAKNGSKITSYINQGNIIIDDSTIDASVLDVSNAQSSLTVKSTTGKTSTLKINALAGTIQMEGGTLAGSKIIEADGYDAAISIAADKTATFSGKNVFTADIENAGALTVNALADDISLTVTGDFTNTGKVVINASALTITDTATQVISISGLVGIDVADIKVITEQAGVVAMVKNDATGTSVADNGIYLCTVDPTVKTDEIFVNDDWASLPMNQKFTFAGKELVFGVNAFASATSLKITADTKVVNFIADSGAITSDYGVLDLSLTNDTTINVLGAVGQTLTDGTAKFEIVSINGNGKKITANCNIMVEDNTATTEAEGKMSLDNIVFTADGKSVAAKSTTIDEDAVLNVKSAFKEIALGTTDGTGKINTDVNTGLTFNGFGGVTDFDVTDLTMGAWSAPIATVIDGTPDGKFTVSGKNVKKDLEYVTPYTKYFEYKTVETVTGLYKIADACNAITVEGSATQDLVNTAVNHTWTVGDATYYADNVYITGNSEVLYLQGNSNQFGDQFVNLQGDTNTKYNGAIYGGKLRTGASTAATMNLGGDINLTINGGDFKKVVVGGDRINPLKADPEDPTKQIADLDARAIYYRDGDINLTINGGLFENYVAAGSLYQGDNTRGSIEVNNTNLTITAGTFNYHVYGGNYATTNKGSKRTTIQGKATVTLVAGKNISINGTLFVGSIGNGVIYGGTELILTGSNVDEKTGAQTSILHAGDIWGGSAQDKVIIEDNGNRVFTGGTEGVTRQLTFTGFNGILDSQNVHGFSSVLVEDSVATLKDTVTLVDVNEWEIKAGSTLNGAFKNDFTGDTLELTGLDKYDFDKYGDWTIFGNTENFKFGDTLNINGANYNYVAGGTIDLEGGYELSFANDKMTILA